MPKIRLRRLECRPDFFNNQSDFGIICVTNAFDVMKTATVVVGIILIFNGVSNIWITSRATKAESAYNKQKEFEATFVEDRKEDN